MTQARSTPINIPWTTKSNESINRIFSKKRRYTTEKKIVRDRNYSFDLTLPSHLERTHCFYDRYATEKYKGQIIFGKQYIYVTLMNKQTEKYDKLIYFDKENGRYISEVGLPAPDLYNFGITTREDRLFIIGGLVPSEPGYRKNFLLEPSGWSRMNNNLSEGEVFRTFFDKKTKTFVYRCSERIYTVNAETKKGSGFGIRNWKDNPDQGEVIGFRNDHVFAWDFNKTTREFRVLPIKLEEGRLTRSTTRTACTIPESECRAPYAVGLAEDTRAVISSDLGTFNAGFVDGKYQKTDVWPSSTTGMCEEIGKGIMLINVNDRQDFRFHCAYSGDASPNLYKEGCIFFTIHYGLVAQVDANNQNISFYKLTDL